MSVRGDAGLLPVAERFVSVNGEGPRSGRLAAFLRFQGCNLACSYCDTTWANAPDCPVTRESPAQLASYVAGTGARLVTLTGGEPLLQPALPELLQALCRVPGLAVIEIETNGAVDLAPFALLRKELTGGPRIVFTMDWKLPSSGMASFMLPPNLALLEPDDTVKFVVGSPVMDLPVVFDVITGFGLQERCGVYLSPVFGRLDPAALAAFVIDNRLNGVTVQLQLHKALWPGVEKGV